MQPKAGEEPGNEATRANFEHSIGCRTRMSPFAVYIDKGSLVPRFLPGFCHTIYILKNTKRSLGTRLSIGACLEVYFRDEIATCVIF